MGGARPAPASEAVQQDLQLDGGDRVAHHHGARGRARDQQPRLLLVRLPQANMSAMFGDVLDGEDNTDLRFHTL